MDCSSDFQSADFAQDFIVQAPGVKTISVPIDNADLSLQSSESDTIKSTKSEVLNNLVLAQHKEIQQLKNRVENTKLFTFMIIHDLKHPTESLIATLKQVHQQLICTSVELITVKKQNQLLKEVC